MSDPLPVEAQAVLEFAQQAWAWLGFTPATIIATLVALWAARLSRRTSLEVAGVNRESQRELAREAEGRAERRAEVERSLSLARQRPGKYRTMAVALRAGDLSVFRALLRDLGHALGRDDPHVVTRSGRYGLAFAAFAGIDNEAANLAYSFHSEAMSREAAFTLDPPMLSSAASHMEELAGELHDFLEVLERTAREYVEQPGPPPAVTESDDQRIEEILTRRGRTTGPGSTIQ